MARDKNIITRLRQLRGLPRALFAVLVLVVAQTTMVPCAMATGMTAGVTSGVASDSMSEHCAYCPSVDVAAAGVANGCAFPHAPTVDVYAGSTQHVSVLLDSPLLQPATFGVSDLRHAQIFYPVVRAVPLLTRPLTLTHCVQLK
jgi:hypothetical protein